MCKIEENYIDRLYERIVIEEIENALALYPDSLSQTLWVVPELRDKIITYVVSQSSLPPRRLEHHRKFPIKRKFPYHSLELRLKIEAMVHQAIQAILKSEFGLLSDPPSLNQFTDLNFKSGDRISQIYSRVINMRCF